MVIIISMIGNSSVNNISLGDRRIRFEVLFGPAWGLNFQLIMTVGLTRRLMIPVIYIVG
jgi:hypothetical protein